MECQTISEWIANFEQNEISLKKKLVSVYCSENLASEKKTFYLETLKKFKERFGDLNAYLFRAPARVNLLGRHIDHQGGIINSFTFNRDVILVVAPRNDDVYRLDNVNEQFLPKEFSLKEILPKKKFTSLDDWESWILKTRKKIKEAEWSDYIQGVLFYFQKFYLDKKNQTLKGFDAIIHSDIPSGGLCSSSALITVVAEAIKFFNSIRISKKNRVEETSNCEWFIGSIRCGNECEIAIYHGKANHIIRFSDFPPRWQYIPFPKDLGVVVFDSGVKSNKSGGKNRSIYNQRIEEYRYARMIIDKFFPKYKKFSSINDIALKLSDRELYTILLALPQKISRKDLLIKLEDKRMLLEKSFESHNDPKKGYNLRGTLLYGLAECQRSFLFGEYLKEKKIAEAIELINISHNGDRVKLEGREKKLSNEYLLDKIKSLGTKSSFGIAKEPGLYNCSVSELDEMVDISLKEKKPIGAQMLGAGFGGNIMVITKKNKLPKIIKRMKREYYSKKGLNPKFIVCHPAMAACML